MAGLSLSTTISINMETASGGRLGIDSSLCFPHAGEHLI